MTHVGLKRKLQSKYQLPRRCHFQKNCNQAVIENVSGFRFIIYIDENLGRTDILTVPGHKWVRHKKWGLTTYLMVYIMDVRQSQ